MKRDFLALDALSRAELDEILHLSAKLKRELKAGRREPLLAGKTLAMIFEKPSLRTRVTFEVGMTQLGGYAVYLTPTDIRLGERESVADIARNLERWVDCIMGRVFQHATLEELARYARVPIINGLCDVQHPCQVLSDCFTVLERRGRLDGLKVAWLGDGNNVANSWIAVAPRFGFSFALACPPGFEPDAGLVARARAEGAAITVTQDVREAVSGADVLYTDVWTSMGQEAEAEARKPIFAPYQLNAAALKLAKPDAVVMHCLPAHRGEEVTGEVIDGPQSIVFDQAENRLHVQKGIMVWLHNQTAKH
ncbi:MAG: ornithine carbamoyltransferase [Deltaproteobacteria bacterium]|nr:ornithine carbamoyltransferase [Deltaproteobacteria bacterium]